MSLIKLQQGAGFLLLVKACYYEKVWDLEIYKKAYELAIKVHAMSLTLPKYELNKKSGQKIK